MYHIQEIWRHKVPNFIKESVVHVNNLHDTSDHQAIKK